MTEPIGPSAAPVSAPAPSQDLSPRLQKALAAAGIDPSEFKGAWATYGLTPAALPGLMEAQGSSIDAFAKVLADNGVTAADFPAIADFLGVPAEQRSDLAKLLHLPEPAPGTAAPGATAAKDAAPPAKGDAVKLSAPVGKASPIAAMFNSPAVKDMIVDQVFDRDPALIKADRKGVTPEFGAGIAQYGGNRNAVGFHVGIAPELKRLRFSGNEAAQWAFTIDAPLGVGLSVGSGVGLVQTDVNLRASVGRVYAGHSKLLGRTVETSFGVYALGGGLAQAGYLGGPNLAVGVRAGGGVNLGPVFLEATHGITTSGSVDQATVGLRLTL